MAKSDKPDATVEQFTPNAMFSAVSASESNMRTVKSLALILFDYLSDAAPLDEARQAALCYVAGELLHVGYSLDENCDALFEIARKQR